MDKSHFSLTWDKFHSSMCAGFSLLQQNGELVDMTLAADGHFVKVHQIVLSIASSFIKDLIQSADCKHPVIFMNNVSYKTLCSILEYVYTGEVSVEEKNIDPFFEAAKSLQIRGLDETVSVNNQSAPTETTCSDNTRNISAISFEEMPVKTETIVSDDDNNKIKEVKQPYAMRSTPRKRKSSLLTDFHAIKEIKRSSNNKRPHKEEPDTDTDEIDMDSGDQEDNAALDDFDSFSHGSGEEDLAPAENKEITKPNPEFQYTVSNRGSLQMILNRFMYNLCSRGVSTARGPVRRWRCVDYRNHACPASAVTDHNVVVKRANLHNHPFHDKRILNKIERKAVYSAIQAKEIHPDATD